MVEALPILEQFGINMNPSLKVEKNFVHGLDKCHALAIQEDKVHTVRNQMCDDLTAKVNPNERGKERQGMLNKYVECIRKIEEERKSYLETFKGIYPNSDKIEEKITQDVAKIKKVEDQNKEASTLYTKMVNTNDPKAKEEAIVKYQNALKTYKDNHEAARNEFKESYLGRMESVMVSFNITIALI